MNIIGGEKRGARLASLQGRDTRPTAQRTREALFNLLEGGRFGRHLLSEHTVIWDVFAGTGAIGLEALSRGLRPGRDKLPRRRDTDASRDRYDARDSGDGGSDGAAAPGQVREELLRVQVQGNEQVVSDPLGHGGFVRDGLQK